MIGKKKKITLAVIATVISILVGLATLSQMVLSPKMTPVIDIDWTEERRQHLEDLKLILENNPELADKYAQTIVDYLNREQEAFQYLIDSGVCPCECPDYFPQAKVPK